MSFGRSSSGARGRRHRRRGGGGLSRLGMVLGSGLTGLALFFLFYGFTAKPSDVRDLRFRMSVACVAASVAVFAARAGSVWLSERKRRPSASPFERAGRNGAALVLVLVLLGALAGLSLQVADLGLSLRSGARRALLREDLKAAAWIGLLRGAQALADDEDKTSDPAEEPWMRGEWTHPSGLLVTLRIRDAQARMDLNALSAARTGSPSTAIDVVTALLRSSGVEEPDLWMERIRTATSSAEPERIGSERTERAGRPFSGWDTVREAVGPDRFDAAQRNEEVATALFRGLTVLPSTRGLPNRVNLQSAPEPVLRALMGPGSEAAVRTFVARREAGPLRGAMGPVAGLNLRRLERIRDLVDVRSEYFHILCTAELGTERIRLSALLRRESDGTCRPIRWGQCP